MRFKRTTYMLTFLFVITSPAGEGKKGFYFPNRILVEKWGKLTETGKKQCIWPVLSSCYLGFPLLTLFFQLLFLFLTHAQTTEHSAAVNASRLTLNRLPQAAYWAGCAAVRAPRLERSAFQTMGHNTSSKMVAHRTPWREAEAVHDDATCLAVWRTQVLSLRDTNKVDKLCYSPFKIQDLLKN